MVSDEKTPGRLRRLDGEPRLVAVARALRRRLPGDVEYGDRLSTAGDLPSQQLGRAMVSATTDRPSALREVGLSALQVWQALSESQGRGQGERELTICFTDLVGFSAWALEAGDEAAIALLRRVGEAIEPTLEAGGGQVVKRLGDGVMAVFDDPSAAVHAAIAASAALDGVEVAGYRPRLRAGLHHGTPRKLGGDYLGVDVNIAARVAEAAGPGEVLVTEAICEHLPADTALKLRKKWFFSAKGAPKGMQVFAASLV